MIGLQRVVSGFCIAWVAFFLVSTSNTRAQQAATNASVQHQESDARLRAAAPVLIAENDSSTAVADENDKVKKKKKSKKKHVDETFDQSEAGSGSSSETGSAGTESKVDKTAPVSDSKNKTSIFDEVHKGDKPYNRDEKDDDKSDDNPEKKSNAGDEKRKAKARKHHKSAGTDSTTDSDSSSDKTAKAKTSERKSTRKADAPVKKTPKASKSGKKGDQTAKDDSKQDEVKADKPDRKSDKIKTTKDDGKDDGTPKTDKSDTKPAFTGTPAPSKPQFTGNASWYGIPFHGRKTASGEVFNMYRCSAAHKSLPLVTKVLVEDPRTGNTVMVRVNDRGPYVGTRVMDLSREAARELGTMSRGVYYIEATILGKE